MTPQTREQRRPVERHPARAVRSPARSTVGPPLLALLLLTVAASSMARGFLPGTGRAECGSDRHQDPQASAGVEHPDQEILERRLKRFVETPDSCPPPFAGPVAPFSMCGRGGHPGRSAAGPHFRAKSKAPRPTSQDAHHAHCAVVIRTSSSGGPGSLYSSAASPPFLVTTWKGGRWLEHTTLRAIWQSRAAAALPRPVTPAAPLP